METHGNLQGTVTPENLKKYWHEPKFMEASPISASGNYAPITWLSYGGNGYNLIISKSLSRGEVVSIGDSRFLLNENLEYLSEGQAMETKEQYPLQWLGTLFVGSILALDALALGMYYVFAPSRHDVSWQMASMIYPLGVSGLSTTFNQGIILISSQKDIFPFTVTLEKLGFYPWILIFAGAVVLIPLASRDLLIILKRLSGFIGLSLIYLLLRYVLLVHVFFSTDMPAFAMERMQIFIDPWWLMASFIPLVLLPLWLYPGKDSDINDGPGGKGNTKFDLQLKVDKRMAVALLAVMVSVFCLTSAVIFQGPGTKKDGRILVDEIHSLWESSTLKLDKNWYCEGSTYNAYSMVEWLKDSYKVDRIVSPILQEPQRFRGIQGHSRFSIR